jgi:hypothetical protein
VATITKGGVLPDTGVTKDEIYALVDNATLGTIVNSDIASNAAIDGSKLAGLTNIAVGAGQIPTANLPLTLTSATTGFTVVGGTTPKTLTTSANLTVSEDTTLAGTPALANPLGAWSDVTSAHTNVHALTDGFVLASATCSTSSLLRIKTDVASTPTVVRAQAGGTGSNSDMAFVMSPVRKNDYWNVDLTGGVSITTVYWIILGT